MPRICWSRNAIALAIAALVMTTGTATAASPQLACSIRVPETGIAGRPVRLAFELGNKGAAPVRVLTWNTPLEGWFGAFLKVVRDGTDVPYEGPMVKRSAPAEDDYVRIVPGAKVGATLDLAQVYAIAAPGLYTVTFTGPLHDVVEGRHKVPGAERRPVAIACAPVQFRIGKR